MILTGKLSFELNLKQKKLFGVIIKVFASLFLGIILISSLTFIPALKNNSKMVAAYNVQMRGFILEFTQFKSGIKFFTPADEIDESSIQKGDTTMQRILIWQNTLGMIKEHPWLGVGLGNFKIAYQPYRSRKEQLSTGPDVFVRRTHNEWLQLLAELGIPGFIFFLMIQGVLYYSAHQIIVRSKNFHIQALMLGFAMSFIAIFVTAIFGFALQNPNPCFTLWTLAGLFSAYYWIVWYKEDYRSLVPTGISLKDVFLGKFVKQEEATEDQREQKKNGKARKRSVRKENDIDPDVGLWVFPDILKKILMPIFIVFMIFGIVSHYWIWKPAHAFYNRQFGQALQRMGRHDKAKILFDKSLKDEPLAWETRFLLANEFAAMNQLEDAKREHTFSLKLNPYHAKGHYNLANTLNKLGDTKESLEHYKRAVEYDNMLYQAYLNLGAMHFQKREYEQCLEFYKMSIAANPKFFSAYYNIAYALAAMGRVGEALPYLQKAKELNPGNPKVRELESRIQNMIAQHNKQQVQKKQQQSRPPQA
jgi:tetratricopeptide (TPR) repeat protein